MIQVLKDLHYIMLLLYSFDPDPTIRHSFWSLVIGSMINWTGPYGASQQSTQRFGSLPTLRKAKMYGVVKFLETNPRVFHWIQHKSFSRVTIFSLKISYIHILWIFHIFQSSNAAKRRTDRDCDNFVYGRCRCFRLLRHEGLWSIDQWRHSKFESSIKYISL